MQLLVGKLVRLGVVDTISDETVRRYDYEYRRMGMGSLFCPARGWRHVIVSEHHGNQDCAQVIRWLLDEHFSEVESIRLVVDNLNTHSPASLYTAFSAEEARRLTRKLDRFLRIMISVVVY
jgi:hypothetical protein